VSVAKVIRRNQRGELAWTGRWIVKWHWRNRSWKPACQKTGIDADPYDLRHTFCSLLAREGRSMPYIASQMGHSLIETQRHYSHIIEDARLVPGTPMERAVAEARSGRHLEQIWNTHPERHLTLMPDLGD